MTADAKEHITRLRRFASHVVTFADELPKSRSADVVARQLIRSATSVYANYRAACRARSRAEMAAKLGVVEEEADETIGWLELLVEVGHVPPQAVRPLLQEANEITAMTVASIKTIRTRHLVKPKQPPT